MAKTKVTSLKGNARTRAKSQLPAKPETALTRKELAAPGLAPPFTSAAIVQDFGVYPNQDIFGLVEELADQCVRVQKGDLRRVESMLVSQAHSLDVLFANLSRRAALNFGEHLHAAEVYMRLALKAQSQCRTTLETLATIKNPPIVFAKQANIAQGHQQVNNGEAAPAARGEARILHNEQSRLTHETGQWLDSAASPAAIGADSRMEALAAGDGAKDCRGKGKIKPKRVEGRHPADAARTRRRPARATGMA